ncbi:hypothetical protein BC830DRAFT_1221151 [Chytriomyces sp. MP71]|nr:hypothetical protein BC830DRAFT_1221151 [Chytriomyces sp. MP71]
MRHQRLILAVLLLIGVVTFLAFPLFDGSPSSSAGPRPFKGSPFGAGQQPLPMARGNATLFKHKLDKIAVVLKTGSETLLDRVSIQMATFLQHAPNLVVVGDKPGHSIGAAQMLDVYSDLYSSTRKRLGLKADGSQDATVERKKKGITDAGRRRDDQTSSLHAIRDRVVSGQDVQADGWKADAHKNLPAFKVLYETYPEADFYIMIDDDSFVYWDNFIESLQGRDPEVPYYTGQNNHFKGCDGIPDFGIGVLIAQGGAGIVASRGAMKRMMGVVDKCILRYKDCWAGDIRTALCFRDAGVLIDWGVGFHGVPPSEDFIYGDNPCEKPSVFHHVLPWQMQKLYDTALWDLALNPELGTTMGSIYTAFHGAGRDVRIDTDRKGGDYANAKVVDVKACEKRCEVDGKCVSWVFDTEGVCWLKNSPRALEKRKGITSGVVAGSLYVANQKSVESGCLFMTKESGPIEICHRLFYAN